MKKIIIILLLLVAVVAGIFWFSWKLSPSTNLSIKKAPLTIGFSLGVTREERWFKDRDLFVEKVKDLGAATTVFQTDQDVDVQISQIRNLISQKVKVIVIVPADFEKLTEVINEAHAAGIKTIAYDRLIKNSNLDLYVSFDSVKVGKMEAEGVLAAMKGDSLAYIGGSPTDNNAFLLKEGTMSVLNDKIASGDLKLVVDKFMDNWDSTKAYEAIKEYLATGGKLDGIIAANDGTAFGAINALTEKGLAGQIPVSGQDAELAACQRIIAGTQTMTVYKPIRALAQKAAELAVAIAKGDTPETNSVINNGQKDVPTYYIDPTIVTVDNMETTVISDHFYTYEQVYGKAKVE
jgi:D-xylose transport system substrate-binding protein